MVIPIAQIQTVSKRLTLYFARRDHLSTDPNTVFNLARGGNSTSGFFSLC